MRKIINKINIIIFCSIIALVGLLYLFLPETNYSATEKKYLAEFPEITFESIKCGKFSEDFEKYLSDHTPFRTMFVSINAYYEVLIGNNGSNDIYLGKNGWLIEKPVDESNRFEKNMSKIFAFSETANIPVYIIPIPSKGYFYGEYLTKDSLTYNDNEYIDYIKENKPDTLTLVDISDIFLKAENKDSLFYRTDHHWTSDGAFTAYKEFCKVAGFIIPEASDYSIESYSGFYGTSYAKSCYTLTKPDTVKLYRNNINKGKADIVITESEISKYNNLFFTDNLKSEDMYTVFLDGNHSRIDIKTGNKGRKLLVIKDSFAHCFVPFLAENYSEIVMIDLRYYQTKSAEEILRSEGINEVLFLYSIENLATSKDIYLK